MNTWTEQELRILKEEYPTTPTKAVAKMLRKKPSQVSWMAQNKGIRKKTRSPHKGVRPRSPHVKKLLALEVNESVFLPITRGHRSRLLTRIQSAHGLKFSASVCSINSVDGYVVFRTA